VADKDFVIQVGDFVQIRILLHTEKGRVKDFVVQLELLEDREVPIARYDYAHGFAHRDVYHRDGRKTKEEVHESGLEAVVRMAISDFRENWPVYLRRCGYDYEEN